MSLKSFGSENVSPRQLKHIQANNNLRDIPSTYNGPVVGLSGGAAPQSNNGGPSSLSFYNTPSPMTAQVYFLLFPFHILFRVWCV